MVTPHISSLVSQQKDQKVSNVYIFLWLSQEKVSNKSMVKSTQSFGPLPTGHPGTRRAAALIAVLLGLHSLSFIPQAQGVPRRCWYGYSVYDENVCIVYEYIYTLIVYEYIYIIYIYMYVCIYIYINQLYLSYIVCLIRFIHWTEKGVIILDSSHHVAGELQKCPEWCGSLVHSGPPDGVVIVWTDSLKKG